jgi:hypothetical protein
VKRSPTSWLIAVVGASFLARTVVGWHRSTPTLFPDEYTYAEIGRSLSESGRPLVRGGAAHFPALLEPLLAAPLWLVHDVGLAYRLVQTLGALAMSLAAVPVFLLARRLGLSARVALVLAALAALVPDGVYASHISSEAVAYPLALAAVYSAVHALSRPTGHAQLAFAACAGLATLARIQFGILPVVYTLAVIAMGLREQRVKAALRDHALGLGIFGLAAAATVAAGLSHALGIYRGLLDLEASPVGVIHWAALDAMTLAYAAGWVIVPGGLIGLWLALARPRSRDELAFGTVAALFAAALLVEAGFLQASLTAVEDIQERYVFYAIPLLGLAFALYASRGWPLRVAHLGLFAVLVVVSVRLPLTAYATPATLNGSPLLDAVYWLELKLGRPADAASVVAAAVGLMSALAVLASRRPRLGTPVVLAAAVLATGTASAGAVALDIWNAGQQRRTLLPSDPSWVDRARLGRAQLVQSWGGVRAAALQQLFWNRSIDSVLLLPGATPIDGFGTRRARVAGDGSLLVAGRPVQTPLLVDEYGSTVRLQGAHMLGRGLTSSLWRPAGNPRLSLYATGRYHDRWLAVRGAISVWPETAGGPVAGWLSMRLTAPIDGEATEVMFRTRGGGSTLVHLRPGERQRVQIPLCGTGRWDTTYRASTYRIDNRRLVSVRATAPVFTPEASACPSAAKQPT